MYSVAERSQMQAKAQSNKREQEQTVCVITPVLLRSVALLTITMLSSL